LRFWVKAKAAEKFQPEEYSKYFEDWNRAPNAGIGTKGNLKTVPSSKKV